MSTAELILVIEVGVIAFCHLWGIIR